MSSRSARRRFRSLAVGALVMVILATHPVEGDTELVLVDGRVLQGTSVRRDGGEYVLTLETGDEISLPAELVESVRLRARREDEVPEETEPPLPGLGFRAAGPEPLSVAPPEGPSGLIVSDPQQLEGMPVRPRTPSEQTAVFGEPARFQPDIVDNSWEPSSDWDMDPEKNNNFAPSTWAEDIVDNSWEPKSAWDPHAEDVLKSGHSTWQKGVIDPTWTPTDGFTR
jgi:hypothetical protein